jgi:hypothetical protein
MFARMSGADCGNPPSTRIEPSGEWMRMDASPAVPT